MIDGFNVLTLVPSNKNVSVIPLQFDYAGSFSEGLARVQIGWKYGLIDKTGKIVIEPMFDDVYQFSERV